jgi:hypothetical protein
MRTRKDEGGRRHGDVGFPDASQHLGRFLDEVDQQKRSPSALGSLTPAECETQGLQQQRITTPVKGETP